MKPEVKKLFDGSIWAIDKSARRHDPESLGLDRREGWPVSYEQKNTGKNPELGVWNQLHCEVTSALKLKLHAGFMPWDPDIDWIADDVNEIYSFVKGSDCKIYRAIKPSGPNNGGSIDPVSNRQTSWEKY